MIEKISYKDPDGYVRTEQGKITRYLSEAYKDSYDHLMLSGLYEKLVKEGLLIPHTEGSLASPKKGVYKVLYPEYIDYISFPYEWSFLQWRSVILAFLKINVIALEHGMILKDATPFNFTFYKGKPIFFDTSSFEFYKDGQPWIAYSQFCEEMLGPFALMKYRSPKWGAIFSSSIKGFDLGFVSAHLPRASYFNLTCLMHIHWHSSYKNKSVGKAVDTQSGGGFTRQKLVALWQMMGNTAKSWNKPFTPKNYFWSAYYQEFIESESYQNEKKDKVGAWLQRIQPAEVIDFGANTGVFSFLAAAASKKVVAVEMDPFCVDQLYKDIKAQKQHNILPMVADLMQPYGGLGWNNEERPALLSRLKAEMVMGLALIHHLCITHNVPMEFVAELFANATKRYLIIEFIPKSDEKVQRMLQNRADIFDGYTEENFMYAFSNRFRLLDKFTSDHSQRSLYLWEKV